MQIQDRADADRRATGLHPRSGGQGPGVQGSGVPERSRRRDRASPRSRVTAAPRLSGPEQTAARSRRRCPPRRVHSAPEIVWDVDVVEQVVLRAFHLDGECLRGRLRGRASVAFARQVAMYVLHIHLGVSLTRSGGLFGRDRTTAAHAVRVVEDRRDEGRIDRLVGTVESALARWASARAGGLGRSVEERLQ